MLLTYGIDTCACGGRGCMKAYKCIDALLSKWPKCFKKKWVALLCKIGSPSMEIVGNDWKIESMVGIVWGSLHSMLPRFKMYKNFKVGVNNVNISLHTWTIFRATPMQGTSKTTLYATTLTKYATYGTTHIARCSCVSNDLIFVLT